MNACANFVTLLVIVQRRDHAQEPRETLNRPRPSLMKGQAVSVDRPGEDIEVDNEEEKKLYLLRNKLRISATLNQRACSY